MRLYVQSRKLGGNKTVYTVLVADDNPGWLEALSQGLGREKEFEVVGCAYNGREALEMIERLHPDILILDIIMPECDGVYIVNYIRRNIPGYNPIIYMLSGIGSDTVITILNELDIDFYSMKPISLKLTIENLKKILAHKTSVPVLGISRDRIIKEALVAMGIPPNLTCNKHIYDALRYFPENPESFGMLTKILYPHIAELNDSTPSAVEKNIRFGIKRMCSESTNLYRSVFRNYLGKKITNGIFLTVLCAHIDEVFENNRGWEV